MEKAEFKKFYEMSGEMTHDDLLELLESTENDEEQGFYVAVSDYFLQKRQQEVIAKGIF